MEIVIFNDKTWKEIPKQDNPAFDYYQVDEYTKHRHNECLMITKASPYMEKVAIGGYVVNELPIKGDVIHRGLFWHLEHAELFAEALAKNKTTESL
jgi:hypothetical protein